ncbi:MAG: phosphoenolpyruvate--protein phosphotransferase [Betaproteobacteria bacterium]
MTRLILQSPLSGWCLPLAEVPDPVFAERMAGDGVAIDPTGNVLHAPCDGVIVPMQGAKHALTLRAHCGHEILMHVGIDTVQLGGEGFEPLVQPGQAVTVGQALLRVDLDLIARRARSTVTPILLTSGGRVLRRSEHCALAAGDFLMEVEMDAAAAPDPSHSAPAGSGLSRFFDVAFDHGLHARPSALIAAALRPLDAQVTVIAGGRGGNARSTVALMSLGIHCGDRIEFRATGRDAGKAMVALEALLGPAGDTGATTSGEPADPVAAKQIESRDQVRRVAAVVACSGIAIGHATQLTHAEIVVAERGTGISDEMAALDQAIAQVKAHLEGMAGGVEGGGEQQTILSAHIELIQDPEIAARAGEHIQRGKSAGFAWRRSLRSVVDTLQASGDLRMMERVADLRDLENQVVQVLSGRPPGHARTLPERAILIADELLPSQLMSLDANCIVGICTARGGPTSHVAIIAAAMGIPALVAAGPQVLGIADGTLLVLNAEHGHVDIAPSDSERVAIEQDLAGRAAQHAADLLAAQQVAMTRDQRHIKVYANLGALAEAAPAVAKGAEGCGLLRSEFLFLDRRLPPDEDEQAHEYQAIAVALGSRPLTVRTLDIGGDKPIAYLPLPREDNPALGLRGLRTSLWQPQLLRTQLCAILRVQPAGQCRILLPMVTDVGDVRVVRALLAELRTEMALAELPALGVMIETPASALLADQLAREVDFLSIGSNDLSQYTLAMDRGHPELAARLDALHPAVLRLIGRAADAGNAQHKEVAVCGGLGSDPLAIPILIGLGVHEVSAVPAMIPRIKRVIRSLDTRACAALAQQALELPDAAAVRALVERWRAAQPPAPAPATHESSQTISGE